MADLRNFVNHRHSAAKSANSRRQAALGLKVRSPDLVLRRHTQHGASPLGQEILKDEELSDHYTATGDSLPGSPQPQFFKGTYLTSDGTRADIYNVEAQHEDSGSLFGTDASSALDGSSLSDAQASNRQREFNNDGPQNKRGQASQTPEINDDEEVYSGSEDDEEGDFPQDPDPTLTLRKSIIKETRVKVPLRTKSVGQSHSQDHGRQALAEPRPRYNSTPGSQRVSYPANVSGEVENPDTQYTDIGPGGSQSISQPQASLPTQNYRGSQLAKSHYMNVSEGEAEAPTETAGPTRRASGKPKATKTKHSHPSLLDYPPQVLSTMQYAQLAAEHFDTDPNAPASSNTPTDPLPERLACLSTLPMSTEVERSSTQAEQRAFFASLPIHEWEDCGDWFVDRFGEIVKKMKDARQEKRRVELAFEEEIAARGERVRVKTEKLKEVMGNMQKAGSVLVQEKID